MSPPERTEIPTGRGLSEIVSGLRSALAALPAHFASDTHIEGIDATDLFGLNTILASTIELQVVNGLNRLRHIWDPGGRWSRYHFIRTAQTFPDVRLTSRADDGRPMTVLGIELKGWYLLSKEGEPSFRYTVTPSACAPQDLLVVIPWHLKNILSGRPVIHPPYIEQARYAADYRNWWWTHERNTKDPPDMRRILRPDPSPEYYAAPGAKVSDVPVRDGGANFGRIARIGTLMESYIAATRQIPVAGIPAIHWLRFFQLHTESKDTEEILQRLTGQLAKRDVDQTDAEEIVRALLQIVRHFQDDSA